MGLILRKQQDKYEEGNMINYCFKASLTLKGRLLYHSRKNKYTSTQK